LADAVRVKVRDKYRAAWLEHAGKLAHGTAQLRHMAQRQGAQH
jgi:hypothetical protein